MHILQTLADQENFGTAQSQEILDVSLFKLVFVDFLQTRVRLPSTPEISCRLDPFFQAQKQHRLPCITMQEQSYLTSLSTTNPGLEEFENKLQPLSDHGSSRYSFARCSLTDATCLDTTSLLF